MRSSSFVNLTLILAASVAATGIGTVAIAKTYHREKPHQHTVMASASASLIKKGMLISEKDGCNKCHAATYKGKPGFSPNITSTGEIKHYSEAKFARMMLNGTTDDGGKVRPPMPVYKANAAESKALYLFLKTKK